MKSHSIEQQNGINTLQHQLANINSLRSSQDQVLWNICGIFWAANAILLVALFTSGDFPNNIVGIVISLVGLAFSLTWHKLQNRALGNVIRLEKIRKRLEDKLKIDPIYSADSEVDSCEFKKLLKGKSAREIMPKCCLGGAVFWSIALLFFILRLIICNTFGFESGL
ncbi:MAG: hypothetical protein HQ555_05970 [Candidatus Aminicenantes bacterium]|nr:hypothetical protein [Candidatus Aminicenantes bacterium]